MCVGDTCNNLPFKFDNYPGNTPSDSNSSTIHWFFLSFWYGMIKEGLENVHFLNVMPSEKEGEAGKNGGEGVLRWVDCGKR